MTPYRRFFSCILMLLILLTGSTAARASFLAADTVWEGTIELTEDLLIPAGVTLSIRAGTVITVIGSDSTKTDPEFLSPLTEITVRGRLVAEGRDDRRIRFTSRSSNRDDWAGIIVDGGELNAKYLSIANAEQAILVLEGRTELQHVRLNGNQTGLTAVGTASSLKLAAVEISSNDYGFVRLNHPAVTSEALRIHDNSRANDRTVTTMPLPKRDQELIRSPEKAREVAETALLGDTVWSGRIRITGQVRVPEGSRLIIAPGTLIEFSRSDSNHDGIGESGLLIQGKLIAKGTGSDPITFRSAESKPRAGDWDAVNIMNSDSTINLIEHCRFEHAYRGLHFHFSQVRVSHSVFRNNYRGLQFQESTLEIRNSRFSGNKSGVQGRDSRISFSGTTVENNQTGINLLRNTLNFTDNLLKGNVREGGRIREGTATVENNQFIGNRNGLLIADLFRGGIRKNLLSGNCDSGLSLKNVDNLEISGNNLAANGINGLNLQEARGIIRQNLIVGNTQRGIGILSFSGIIRENSITRNGLFGIENEGSGQVDARGNWWGKSGPGPAILDQATDPRRGAVSSGEPLATPPLFTWPTESIPVDTLWGGEILIQGNPAVLPGVLLQIEPGCIVRFASGAGLTVKGKLLSMGKPDSRIRLTAQGEGKPESWGELLLENAQDSRISYTDIDSATWGIHSHFTNLQLDNVRLERNYGGIRFRSGPMQIRNADITRNHIGIRSYIGTGDIQDSTITDNDIGIFIRERGGSLAIHENDLSGNREYAIRVGDFNTEEIDARRNWWGPGRVEEKIFDADDEPGIGNVLWQPSLQGKPPKEKSAP